MSWDMGFINPPTLKQLEDDDLICVQKSDNEIILMVSYNDLDGNAKDSAFYAGFDEDGYLVYGTVGYGMHVYPIFNALYEKFGTIVVDDDWVIDAASDNWFPDEDIWRDKMSQEEREIIYNIILSIYLSRAYHSNEEGELYNSFYKNSVMHLYEYYTIIRKYNLSFSNIFSPTFQELEKYNDELDKTHLYRKLRKVEHKLSSYIRDKKQELKQLLNKNKDENLPF